MHILKSMELDVADRFQDERKKSVPFVREHENFSPNELSS